MVPTVVFTAVLHMGEKTGSNAELAVRLLDRFDVVRRARAGGAEPELVAWVESLPALIGELLAAWSFEVRGPLGGGTWSVVFEGRLKATGADGVLKVSVPGPHTAGDLRTLMAVQGAAAAIVFTADPTRGAVLMERLGQPLYQSTLDTEAQLRVCVASLRTYWRTIPDPSPFQLATDWVAEAAAKHRAWWTKAGEPCPESLLQHAQETARSILATSAESESVLLMGDPHPANLLAAAHGRGWKWIDLSALYGPREFDLGKMLASWHDAVNAAPRPELVLQRHCAIIAAASGADPAFLWKWGLFHRVTSGLWLHVSGEHEWGKAVLGATEAMAKLKNPAF